MEYQLDPDLAVPLGPQSFLVADRLCEVLNLIGDHWKALRDIVLQLLNADHREEGNRRLQRLLRRCLGPRRERAGRYRDPMTFGLEVSSDQLYQFLVTALARTSNFVREGGVPKEALEILVAPNTSLFPRSLSQMREHWRRQVLIHEAHHRGINSYLGEDEKRGERIENIFARMMKLGSRIPFSPSQKLRLKRFRVLKTKTVSGFLRAAIAGQYQTLGTEEFFIQVFDGDPEISALERTERRDGLIETTPLVCNTCFQVFSAAARELDAELAGDLDDAMQLFGSLRKTARQVAEKEFAVLEALS